MALRRSLLLLTAFLAGAAYAGPTPAPFDLTGPDLEVKVTHDGKSLPASQVPNLTAGDQLLIRADLPSNQSAHYLLVAAFLTGSTNPPPEEWFFPCKTWKPKEKCVKEGLNVTVPKDAQQVLLFMAPETGGDFHTLVSAVRGRPGAFVRATQDLNQAALDRSRLERYLASVRQIDRAEPYTLKDKAPLLARSLMIKVDEKCMDRLPELQAPCLMQGQDSLILNDGHSMSIVEALTASPGTDLLMEASITPQLGYGYYSPYIASLVDIARILDSFTTAQYQYIPALATQRGDKFGLTLNAAPSFHDPQSVLVIALPAVEPAQLPPLHAVDPKEVYCSSQNSLVLPVEGAPLVFSTDYAHDMTLTLTGADGKTIDLPAKADAVQGGFTVDTTVLQSANLGDDVHASLQGMWGFEPYQGPGFQLRNARANKWALASGDEDALIVGRQDTVHLRADSVSCVDGIMIKDPGGKELKAEWKRTGPGEVEVKLPLQDVTPGEMTLMVKQYGQSQPLPLAIQTFSDPGRLDSFVLHAGDALGVLKGSRLDLVTGLSIGGIEFKPSSEINTKHGGDELLMTAQDASGAAALKAGSSPAAKVALKDGRVFPLTATIDVPRPRVALIGKSTQQSRSSGDSNIELANQDELPQDAKLTFSVRAQTPASFGRDQTIEVATVDEAFSALLSVANGGIRLADSKVAVAALDPAKAFGSSAFGPLKFRVVLVSGVAGDWQPLATLVRLPSLKDLQCPASPDLPCKLSGSDLYLLDSIAGDAQFDHPLQVPDGFPGYALPVPHPGNGRLYVKLRDDSSVVNQSTLAVQALPVAEEQAAHALGDAMPAGAGAAPAVSQPVSQPGGGQR